MTSRRRYAIEIQKFYLTKLFTLVQSIIPANLETLSQQTKKFENKLYQESEKNCCPDRLMFHLWNIGISSHRTDRQSHLYESFRMGYLALRL